MYNYPYGQLPPNFQPITTPSAYQPVQTNADQLQRVNGIDSAKAYPTRPNSTVVLFDANDDVMYIKATDASNFPTIRRFRFTEENETVIPTQQYVTVDEFNKFKEEVLNGKQFVQSTNQSNGSNKGNDEVRKGKQQPSGSN